MRAWIQLSHMQYWLFHTGLGSLNYILMYLLKALPCTSNFSMKRPSNSIQPAPTIPTHNQFRVSIVPTVPVIPDKRYLHSAKPTCSPWEWIFPKRSFPFWECLCSGTMLFLGRVSCILPLYRMFFIKWKLEVRIRPYSDSRVIHINFNIAWNITKHVGIRKYFRKPSLTKIKWFQREDPYPINRSISYYSLPTKHNKYNQSTFGLGFNANPQKSIQQKTYPA